MAEFLKKHCDDWFPLLEQTEGIKLFDEKEIKHIAKKIREHEYKLQHHDKCKEDFLMYIQYAMNLLKRVKQLRGKTSMVHKKNDIDFVIANKINNLYRETLFKFQDIRFWIAYIKFCKHVNFQNNINNIIGSMLQLHKDKPICWLITAQWEVDENKNKQKAKEILLQGLRIHSDSQILFVEMIKLELEDALANNEENTEVNSLKNVDKIPKMLQRVYIIYQQAFKNIKNIKFIIKLLNIVNGYKNTENLQCKIINDMLEEYADEPLMWDTMARRELKGLICNDDDNDSAMKVDNNENTTLRDCIEKCNEAYQTAIKRLNTREMWSLYIECLTELYHEPLLPNFKKKLLKSALSKGHQAKKLSEKYYLLWISILSNDKTDSTVQKKLREILILATQVEPNSVDLWHARLKYLIQLDEDTDEIVKIFKEATQNLGNKSLPLWNLRLLYAQKNSITSMENLEEPEQIFQAALKDHPNIAKEMKPRYLEWLQLRKGIQIVRKVYSVLCQQPPSCFEFHQKMFELETQQAPISVNDARIPLETAILSFGSNNVKIWITYIKFELENGNLLRVSTIHERALKTLEKNLTDSFISEYNLMKLDYEIL